MFDTDRRPRRLPRALRNTCLAAACVLGFGLPATAAAGKISPDLNDALATTTPGDEIAVIATFDDNVDADDYQGRRAALIRAMRRAARTAQNDVLEESGAEIEDQFWLVNAAALSASPDEVRELADEPGVATIDIDRPVTVNEIASGAWGAPLASPGAGNWGIAAIRADEVWSAHGLTGEGIRVGNIDTGVTADSPAVAGKVVAWRDFINGGSIPYDCLLYTSDAADDSALV